VTNNAYGKARTYCLGGVEGFKHGQSILTDGPLLTVTMDSDGRFDSDPNSLKWHDLDAEHYRNNDDGKIGGSGNFDGARTMLVRRGCKDTVAKHRWTNTSEFGGDISDPIYLTMVDSNGPALGGMSPGAKDADHYTPGMPSVDKVCAYLFHACKGSSWSDYTDTAFHCFTNPIYAIPMDIDVYYEGELIAHNDQIIKLPDVPYPIPAKSLTFTFTSDLSMADEPTVVEFKQIGSNGDSLDDNVFLCTTSYWGDDTNSGVKRVQYTVKNNDEVSYDTNNHYPCPPYTFVVYIKNPKDCNQNALNPIATLFRIHKKVAQ
jgi:hypothetical protein